MPPILSIKINMDANISNGMLIPPNLSVETLSTINTKPINKTIDTNNMLIHPFNHLLLPIRICCRVFMPIY